MKLSNALAPIVDLSFGILYALPPTILSVIKNPRLLIRHQTLSRTFFAHVWTKFASLVDDGAKEVKQSLITPNAYGHILDIGAGHGHTVFYLDRTKVTRYIALEPNPGMHAEIRKNAAKAGYSEEKGEFVLLGCGAEEITTIIEGLGGHEQCIDTIISILAFCSVTAPKKTIEGLSRRILKPGGQLLYYEHVLSSREDVQWWQRLWAPIWRFTFDGCVLDRPTHVWIRGAGVWDMEHSETWGKPGELAENVHWHSVGKYTKIKDT